jgi:hypothetical protein
MVAVGEVVGSKVGVEVFVLVAVLVNSIGVGDSGMLSGVNVKEGSSVIVGVSSIVWVIVGGSVMSGRGDEVKVTGTMGVLDVMAGVVGVAGVVALVLQDASINPAQ